MPRDTSAQYYLPVADDQLRVGHTVLRQRSDDDRVGPVVTGPRSADLHRLAGRTNTRRHEDLLLGRSPGSTPRLAVLSANGNVDVDDHQRAWCDAGWTITAFEDYRLTLGPNAERLAELIARGMRDFVDDRDERLITAYDAEASSLSHDDRNRVDTARWAALHALAQHHVDRKFWSMIGHRDFGWAIVALAARDLIGTTTYWTWTTYHVLTAPWHAAYGETVHPDDIVPTNVTGTASPETLADLHDFIDDVQRVTALPAEQQARQAARLRSEAVDTLTAVQDDAIAQLIEDNASALPSAPIAVAEILGVTKQAVYRSQHRNAERRTRRSQT